MSSNKQFSSEGFDLDALAATVSAIGTGNNDDGVIADTKNEVIYELGGNVSFVTNNANNTNNANTTEDPVNGHEKDVEVAKVENPLRVAEEYKNQGNDAFLKQEWDVSYDLYSKAIQAVPYDDNDNSINTGVNSTNVSSYRGELLLKLKEEWEKEQYKIARQRMNERDEVERRKRQPQQQKVTSNANDDDKNDDDKEDDDTSYEKNNEKSAQQPEFQPPPHLYGEQLAVYYSNRAAASLQLDQMKISSQTSSSRTNNMTQQQSSSYYDDDDNDLHTKKTLRREIESAIMDCTIAIYLKPNYIKALVRRATAYERLDQTDKALSDIQKAIVYMNQTTSGATATSTQQQQQYKTIVQTERRLQKLEEERMEKLKTETLSKLKDLGNSILGNFGLSLDNFQAKQDPNTGSYSISFNNGGTK